MCYEARNVQNAGSEVCVECRMQQNAESVTSAECGMWDMCGMRARPRNAEVRVLHSNTIWMRLVGALAATFLFRGKSENKKGWQFNDMAVENVSWHHVMFCDIESGSGVGVEG